METIDDKTDEQMADKPMTTTIEKSCADETEEEVMIIGEKGLNLIGGQELEDNSNDSEETKGFQQKAIPRKQNKSGNGVQLNRTYVQILNDMFPNKTRYVEEGRTGPAHAPQFRIAVHVSGLTFHGVSRSKQSARHEAAKEAIQYLSGRTAQPSTTGYGRRYHNRFDYYHRYQPYYSHQSRDPYPHLMPEMPPIYSRRPYDSYLGPNMDYYNEYSYEGYEPQYENSYYDDPWNRESNSLHYRESRPPVQRPVPLLQPITPPYATSPPLRPTNRLMSENTSKVSPNVSHLTSTPTTSGPKNDFTTDDYNTDDSFVEFKAKTDAKSDDGFEEMKVDEQNVINSNKKERIILRVMSQAPATQNPVALIHELQPNAKWVSTELNTGKKGHSTTFQMTLLLPLANECFTGTARTKKLAKSEAASKALLQMYNISINAQNSDNPELCKPKSTVQIAQEPLVLKQDIADRIGREVLRVCDEVWDKLVELKKWTVLSAIVLTDETNADFVEVICMTSGTKCVKGDSLSMNGYALNDCHAEVLSRRSFIHFIYMQIEKLIDNSFEDKPEFIVERRPDGHGFRMKKQYKVNLFISTAPCGDSRVFSPKEETGDAHPNRQTRGLLRAKIEGGEGTIPVKRDAILTWDGILQGHQRLQFMSCSDKIAVWNVVGIQGALLSHLMEPIYVESVVLASLFNYEHLVRALHGRLNLNFDSNSLNGLPQFYAFNKSKVAKCQLKQDLARQLTKAPNYAINWIKGDETPEVVSTESGRIHVENIISRLAKRSLFARFCALLGRNTPTLPTCTLGQSIPLIYRDGKTASLDYQRAKTQCMQAFQEQNLGNWIQVPSEIDLFRL